MFDALEHPLAISSIVVLLALMTTAYYVAKMFRDYHFAFVNRTSREHLDSASNIRLIGENEVREAMAQLKRHAEIYRPDHILGINIGGRIVSSLLSSEIGLGAARCSFVSTDDLRNHRPILKTIANRLSGKVLVVDDITRRGRTLELVNQFLVTESVRGNADISSIQFSTLVLVSNIDKAKSGYFLPNSYGIITNYQMARLPWSSLSASINEALAARTRELEFDEEILNEYEVITSDFEFALAKAKKYLKTA